MCHARGYRKGIQILVRGLQGMNRLGVVYTDERRLLKWLLEKQDMCSGLD
jgi:hypothetical protein